MAVGDLEVETRAAVRFPGMMMDMKLSFFKHINQAADNAAKEMAAIIQLMTNTSAPMPSNPKILMIVTKFILLYGS